MNWRTCHAAKPQHVLDPLAADVTEAVQASLSQQRELLGVRRRPTSTHPAAKPSAENVGGRPRHQSAARTAIDPVPCVTP